MRLLQACCGLIFTSINHNQTYISGVPVTTNEQLRKISYGVTTLTGMPRKIMLWYINEVYARTLAWEFRVTDKTTPFTQKCSALILLYSNCSYLKPLIACQHWRARKRLTDGWCFSQGLLHSFRRFNQLRENVFFSKIMVDRKPPLSVKESPFYCFFCPVIITFSNLKRMLK